jgi:zinc D-Ala-D-Ala dipeptidase
MTLVQITPQTHNVIIDVLYATDRNFTGKPVYNKPLLFLHKDTLPLLEKAIELAAQQGLCLKIFDGFRPQTAQERLWAFCPNPIYVMPPTKGSVHTRGVAIDLTLATPNGEELDMGTSFDSFLMASHHGASDISQTAAANRYRLLGIMMSADWDLYKYEWWHYQLFNPTEYPLIKEDHGICAPDKMAAVAG